MLQKMKAFAVRTAQKTLKLTKERTKPILALILASAAVIAFTLSSLRTVRISDGENTFTVRSLSGDVAAAVKRVSLKSADYRITGITSRFFTTNVELSYVFPLTVTVGKETSVYQVVAGKLGTILESLGISVDEYDIVSRPLEDYICGETVVDIVDIQYETETYSEEIPYSSTVVYSDQYDSSTKKVVSEGKPGTKVITCSVKYVNGEPTETTVISEQVVEQAVDQKTVVGTRIVKMASSGTVQKAAEPQLTAASSVQSVSTLTPPSSLMLDNNGVPSSYSSKKTLTATAYTYTGNNCATGVAPQPGYIAVNPNEIPYGTKMYIVSADGKYVYGYAIAADTGGFASGNRVDLDLFFSSEAECKSFGVRDVIVYFVN